MMIQLVMLILAALAAAGGFVKTRKFVRERLRFVDAVHRSWVPVAAGAGAALVVSPVAWILPFVGAGSALFFGAAVGYGVVKGRKDIRQLPPGRLR